MSKRYNFNHKDFKKYIHKGYFLLKNSNLNPNERYAINDDINFFSSFINNEVYLYEPLIDNNEIDGAFRNLKINYVSFLKKLYNELGEELINFIIDLESESIMSLDCNYSDFDFIIPLENQEEITIKNYEKNSKILYNYAQKVFSNNPTSKIQEINMCDDSSYCHHSYIMNLPFLVINPSEEPYVLNHEVEHGIECFLSLNTNDIYKELGPIYFELLYNDTLYDLNGFLTPNCYSSRLIDTEDILCDLVNVLKIAKELAKYNFVVSDTKLKHIIMDNIGLKNKDVYFYLNNESVLINIKTQIRYLLSYLKAIELRRITDGKKDAFYILGEYINQKKFNFKPNQKNYNVYKDYVYEMKRKSKHNY